MWTFITGTPTNFSVFLKYGISFHSSGIRILRISTEMTNGTSEIFERLRLYYGDGLE